MPAAGYEGTFGGGSTAAIVADDYVEIDPRPALLSADTVRLEVRWAERG